MGGFRSLRLGSLLVLFTLLRDSHSQDAVPRGHVNPNRGAIYSKMRAQLATVVVNGVTITHGEVEDRMKTLRRADTFLTHKKYEDVKPAVFREMARDFLIDEAIALQEAKKRGIRVDQDEIIQQTEKLVRDGPQETRLELLKTGYLPETLPAGNARNAVINTLRRDVCASMSRPPTEEMRRFYKENYLVFETTPERVFARRIFLRLPDEATPSVVHSTRSRAEDLLDRLHEGESFAALADQYTEHPFDVGRGGCLGWVSRGKQRKNWDKILFSQEVGKLPDEPLKLESGFAIVLVENHRDAVYESFDEAIPRVLRGMQIECFRDWLADKRSVADIKYFADLSMTEVLKGGRPQEIH